MSATQARATCQDCGARFVYDPDAPHTCERRRQPAKPPKYRNEKTVIDGDTFDSKLEATRWLQLQALQVAGTITGLARQVTIPIVVEKTRVCKYVADFVYKDESGELVVEDAKGVRTPSYNLKKKLLEAAAGLEIKEFTKPRRARRAKR